MKKSILIFGVILFILLFPILSSAQDTEEVSFVLGDWEYSENNTGITLTVYHGDESDLTIPEILDGKTVTQLGKDLLANQTGLSSVIIPNSVTAIGSGVFSGCSKLHQVQLPINLKRIEPNTFRYCISLETIDIPFAVTQIGNFAFADCISLREVMLLAVTSIGDSAFENCQQLADVMLSRKVTSVGSHAFRDTPWLDAKTEEFVMVGNGVLIRCNGTGTDVEVPYGTTMIADAFEDSYFVETVNLPDTVTQIGAYAFRNAINLREVRLPSYLTLIGVSAFENCHCLEAIELPVTLKTLSASAFKGCSQLTSVTVPASVTALQASLFEDCSNLKEVILPESLATINAKAFQNTNDVLLQVVHGSAAETFALENEMRFSYMVQQNGDFVYTKDADGVHITRYTGSLRDVEIPAAINGDPITSVEAGAFQNNRRVRRVIIPISVKTVGDWAFSYMDNLEYVQMSSGLGTLGANVFTGSAALKEIRIPAGLQSVGAEVFDPDTAAKICAAEGSAAAEQLSGMGYDVRPMEECAADEETMALWQALGAAEDAAVCDCSLSSEPSVSAAAAAGPEDEDLEILRIPDGIVTLDASLLRNTKARLILVVPASVQTVDADILDAHSVETIVSQAGSAVEAFARENGIKFLVSFFYYMNMD